VGCNSRPKMHVRRTPSPRRRHKWSCSHRMTHTISVGLLEWGCNLRQQPLTGARTPPAKTGAELQSGAATTCTRCTSSRSMRQQPCRYHETAAVHAWSTHIPLAGGRSGAATRSDSASFFCTPPLTATPGGRVSHNFYAPEVVYLCQRERAEESGGSNAQDQRTQPLRRARQC
jgi:hypothetical protein